MVDVVLQNTWLFLNFWQKLVLDGVCRSHHPLFLEIESHRHHLQADRGKHFLHTDGGNWSFRVHPLLHGAINLAESNPLDECPVSSGRWSGIHEESRWRPGCPSGPSVSSELCESDLAKHSHSILIGELRHCLQTTTTVRP